MQSQELALSVAGCGPKTRKKKEQNRKTFPSKRTEVARPQGCCLRGELLWLLVCGSRGSSPPQRTA